VAAFPNALDREQYNMRYGEPLASSAVEAIFASMTRDQAIALLQAHAVEIRALGVRELGLFGSVARNEAKTESDVDVLVEFSGPATLDAYMDLKDLLERVLGRHVDLVTRGALKPLVRPEVERELVLVA